MRRIRDELKRDEGLQVSAETVRRVVNDAGLGQWGAPREILSDNGRQLVAWRGKTRFQKVLKQQGVQHVRSAPHHPMRRIRIRYSRFPGVTNQQVSVSEANLTA